MNNKTNIEEDIKIVNKYEILELGISSDLSNENEITLERYNKAIENILADRERLKEENRALREDYQTENQYYEQKIKEKIAELRKNINEYKENEKDVGFKDFWHNELLKATHKMWALQDLLPKEE